MLNINEEYFLKIVETQNISKAAEALYISQPSLTKYLQRLETKLGVELFYRTNNAMRLTAAGRYLYEYITSVTKEESRLQTRIREVQNLGRDTLTIGMPLWRSNVLLPEFMPFFHEKYPLIDIRLREGKAADIEAWIRTEEVDLGVMNLPVNYAEISYYELATEYVLLAASRKNRLIAKYRSADNGEAYPHIDIHEVAECPYILTKEGQHITDFIDQMVSRNHIELNCVFRTSNVGTAINMAATNFGFTFVPEFGTFSRFFPRDDLFLFTVDDPPLRCTLAAVYKKTHYLSHASRIFISTLREFCRNRFTTV